MFSNCCTLQPCALLCLTPLFLRMACTFRVRVSFHVLRGHCASSRAYIICVFVCVYVCTYSRQCAHTRQQLFWPAFRCAVLDMTRRSLLLRSRDYTHHARLHSHPVPPLHPANLLVLGVCVCQFVSRRARARVKQFSSLGAPTQSEQHTRVHNT